MTRLEKLKLVEAWLRPLVNVISSTMLILNVFFLGSDRPATGRDVAVFCLLVVMIITTDQRLRREDVPASEVAQDQGA